MQKVSVLFSLLLLLCGCVSSHVAMLDSSKSYSPTTNIEILLEKPNKPYKQIAILEATGVEGHSDTELLNHLVEKAKKLSVQMP